MNTSKPRQFSKYLDRQVEKRNLLKTNSKKNGWFLMKTWTFCLSLSLFLIFKIVFFSRKEIPQS